MHVERGAACLVIERRTWQGRKAITLARLAHPGARHALTGRFRPGVSRPDRVLQLRLNR
jgi:GntR family transcriptional regulator, histidine utilization repressor